MRHCLIIAIVTCCAAAAAWADEPNWPTIEVVPHSVFQAVHPDGTSAYTGGFPARLRGVVLNNHEDWLDPRPDYTPQYTPWYLGGEWEIFVQAVHPDDFGGTACWIGQNYGNLPWIADPFFSYTNNEWTQELHRLNYPIQHPEPPLRSGDLVEIRARAGLPFAGKMNVNEQHNNDRDPNTGQIGHDHDFDIVFLEREYGLPEPADITLSDLLRDVPNGHEFIWDPTRETGGEHYQSTLVMIKGVKLLDPNNWGPDNDLTLIDRTTRRLPIHLGLNPSFQQTQPPTVTCNVTGILNQESQTGMGGYYLIALHAGSFVCGDANCDGVTDFEDINPFVLALSDPQAYQTRYPGCLPDMNGDFRVEFDDINPFVTILLHNGRCP